LNNEIPIGIPVFIEFATNDDAEVVTVSVDSIGIFSPGEKDDTTILVLKGSSEALVLGVRYTDFLRRLATAGRVDVTARTYAALNVVTPAGAGSIIAP
jgi:hypothetical protein